MTIDWEALAQVSVVSLVATLVVVGIASAGIAALGAVQSRIKSAGGGVGTQTAALTGLRIIGYVCIGLSGLAVLFGIYLIVPFLH